MTDRHERMLDLLASRATEGVDDLEVAELDTLLNEFPDIDRDEFDLAAAALFSAFVPETSEMPAALAAKVRADAHLHVAAITSGTPGSRREESLGRLHASQAHTQQRDRGDLTDGAVAPRSLGALTHSRPLVVPQRENRGSRFAWVLAAAAGLIAVFGWWPRIGGTGNDLGQVVFEPTPSEARTALLAENAELFRKAWTATEDPTAAGASGDVVWSNARNEGYMRIAGLEPNDPGEFQYQLWVFDKARDDRYPVDGGVFDVSVNGEIVVPIRAKIPVNEAVLFAITVEKPGGVVVSDRGRIVLLAQAG